MNETNPYASPQTAIDVPMASVVVAVSNQAPWTPESIGSRFGFLLSFSLPLWCVLLSEAPNLVGPAIVFGSPIFGTIGAMLGSRIARRIDQRKKAHTNKTKQEFGDE